MDLLPASPTTRAIVDRDTGLLDASSLDSFLRAVWLETARTLAPVFRASLCSQRLCLLSIVSVTTIMSRTSLLNRALGDQLDFLHWRKWSIMSLVLRCHVPSMSGLCQAAEETRSYRITVKWGVRHFDLRFVHGCNIVASEVAERCASSAQRAGSPPPARNPRSLPPRLLSACAKNSSFVGCRKSHHLHERKRACAGPCGLASDFSIDGFRGGLPGSSSTEQSRWTSDCFPMSPAIAAKLRPLSVPEASWPQAAPLMRGAGKAGRPPAANYVSPYTHTSSMPLEQELLDKEGFLRHEKAWAGSLVPGQALNIRHNFLPCKAGFKASLWCNSCSSCKDKAGWRGYSEYTTGTKMFFFGASTPLLAGVHTFMMKSK